MDVTCPKKLARMAESLKQRPELCRDNEFVADLYRQLRNLRSHKGVSDPEKMMEEFASEFVEAKMRWCRSLRHPGFWKELSDAIQELSTSLDDFFSLEQDRLYESEDDDPESILGPSDYPDVFAGNVAGCCNEIWQILDEFDSNSADASKVIAVCRENIANIKEELADFDVTHLRAREDLEQLIHLCELVPSLIDESKKGRRDFYVYVHCDADGNVFYVGKGTGKRAWASERHPAWQSYVDEKLKGDYSVKIVRDGLLETQALSLEEELMRTYGDQIVNVLRPGPALSFDLDRFLESGGDSIEDFIRIEM